MGSPAGGMGLIGPSDFTADAAGQSLPPSIDSSSWANLITVQNFTPSLPPCVDMYGYSGCTDNVNQTFAILAKDPGQEAAGSLNSSVQLSFTIAANAEEIIPLETDSWFDTDSRTCCKSISALLITDTGSRPLPGWLSLWYNFTQQPSLQYAATHSLHINNQSGLALIGTHTVRIVASDPSMPLQSPQVKDLRLTVVGAGPTVIGTFPIVVIEDGKHYDYALPGGIFQLNKPYGQLTYSAAQQGDQPLAAWLAFNSSAFGRMSGTPFLHQDSMYNVTITATDTDGAHISTFMLLYVRAPCPAGRYRHFRLQLSDQNDPNWYKQNSWDMSVSAICSIIWTSGQPGSPWEMAGLIAVGRPVHLARAVANPHVFLS